MSTDYQNKNLTINISMLLYERLVQEASYACTSVSEVVRRMCALFLITSEDQLEDIVAMWKVARALTSVLKTTADELNAPEGENQ